MVFIALSRRCCRNSSSFSVSKKLFGSTIEKDVIESSFSVNVWFGNDAFDVRRRNILYVLRGVDDFDEIWAGVTGALAATNKW